MNAAEYWISTSWGRESWQWLFYFILLLLYIFFNFYSSLSEFNCPLYGTEMAFECLAEEIRQGEWGPDNSLGSLPVLIQLSKVSFWKERLGPAGCFCNDSGPSCQDAYRRGYCKGADRLDLIDRALSYLRYYLTFGTECLMTPNFSIIWLLTSRKQPLSQTLPLLDNGLDPRYRLKNKSR